MGADCKSAGSAYAGSNPARPKKAKNSLSKNKFIEYVLRTFLKVRKTGVREVYLKFKASNWCFKIFFMKFSLLRLLLLIVV